MLKLILIWSIFAVIYANPISKSNDTNYNSDEHSIRKNLAAEVQSLMNDTVDPCENFYVFACGNYHEDATNLDVTNLLHLEKQTIILMQMELQTEMPSDTNVDRNLKRFYKSCMESSPTADASARDEFLKWLTDKMPLLQGNKWQENDFDWLQTVGEIIQKTGMATLFKIHAIADFTNNSITRVGLTETDDFGDIKMMLQVNDPMFVEIYIGDIMQIFKIFWHVDDENLTRQTATEYIDFKTQLYLTKADTILHLNNDEIYNLSTIDELQKKYMPTLDFKKLFNVSLDFIPSEVYVNEKYLEKVLQLIANTPKHIVANYLVYTSAVEFIYVYFDGDESSRINCYGKFQKLFYKQLDDLLYRRLQIEPKSDYVQNVWSELKSAFGSTLQSDRLSWMQESTRQQALEKLEAMNLHFLSHADTNFNQQFGELDLKVDDYIHNVIAMLDLQGKRLRAAIHERPIPEDDGWITSIVPSYAQNENWLKIPPGIAHQYVTHFNAYPKAFILATLGAAIGHEMIHGFDDINSRFDAKGNVRNWWDEISTKEFRKRTECFMEHYQQYESDGQKLPELKIQAENIADIGGIRAAYAAFTKWLENSQQNQIEITTLPGLKYTQKQMFFIHYGQLWCRHTDYLKVDVHDIHLPSNHRAIGTLSNFPEFSKEFNCPVGSLMNPVHKCSIY